MTIDKLVNIDKCLLLKSRTKTEAILEIIEKIENNSECSQVENLKKEIFYREQIMSTGIGQGIGVPHVRFSGAKNPIVYIAISKNGIADYESLDNQLVKIVILIVVGEDQHKEYLRILSLIVKKIKDKDIQEKLLACSNENEIVEIIKIEDL